MSSRRPNLLLLTASSPEVQRVRRYRVLNSQQVTMPYMPFPGTRLVQRFEARGGILTRDWSKYNGRADGISTPTNACGAFARRDPRGAVARFYSRRSVARRLALSGAAVLDITAEFACTKATHSERYS